MTCPCPGECGRMIRWESEHCNRPDCRDVLANAMHGTFPLVDEVARLERLRAAGVTSVTFHPTGELASVSFEPSFTPASADQEEEQRDRSTPEKRIRRSSGRLIPREPDGT